MQVMQAAGSRCRNEILQMPGHEPFHYGWRQRIAHFGARDSSRLSFPFALGMETTLPTGSGAKYPSGSAKSPPSTPETTRGGTR